MANEIAGKTEWGGKRDGSGRKRTGVKTIGLRIPQDVADILADAATRGLKPTEYIIQAIRIYHDMET